MKQLIAVFFLLAITFAANAQEKKLTFDETVKYINNKIGSHKSAIKNYYIYKFTANKNGEIIFSFANETPISRNLFSLKDTIYLKESPTAYMPRYLRFTFAGDDSYYLRLNDDNLEELQKIKRAFEYLKSLCTKESDPFGN